jgi:hypothetical protein
MDITIDILLIGLLALCAGGWILVGIARRKYHWRRSVERLDRVEWRRLVYALRISGQD